MTKYRIMASAALAAGVMVLAQSGAEARIRCEGNFQVVNGHLVSTPYCREQTLARVARSYGFRVSDHAIRYNESTKADVCYAIGYDNRVYEICTPYRPAGGAHRDRF